MTDEDRISGTYASFTERVIHDDQHAKCGQCGRLLKLRRNHVIPHHRPPAVPTPVPPPSKPKGVEGESPERLSFVQSDEWNQRNGLGPNTTQDIYSDSNCCYCFRKTRPDAQRLAMIRTHDGEWWLITPTAPVRSDEWDRFSLPVGPDCLRNHPEWRFALAVEDPATGQPLPAEREVL